MTFRLVFTKRISKSNPDRHETTLNCKSLGYLYRITEYELHGIVQVVREDLPGRARHEEAPATKEGNSEVVLPAKFVIPRFSQSQVKFSGGAWEPLHTFLHRQHILSRKHWGEYRWKRRRDGPVLSKGKGNIPVVTFYRGYGKKNPSYLEVYDPLLRDIKMLDSVVGEIAPSIRSLV
ncbi:hypothetical protein FRC17_006501 [Serendipita sp. 399]|nr:hypothetical protein FRC17_006501 [Serendipita sp. 399]